MFGFCFWFGFGHWTYTHKDFPFSTKLTIYRFFCTYVRLCPLPVLISFFSLSKYFNSLFLRKVVEGRTFDRGDDRRQGLSPSSNPEGPFEVLLLPVPVSLPGSLWDSPVQSRSPVSTVEGDSGRVSEKTPRYTGPSTRCPFLALHAGVGRRSPSPTWT